MHWFCIYKISEEIVEVFDSLGSSEKFVRQHMPHNCYYEFNTTPLQCASSTSCGAFCVVFAVLRLYHLDLDFDHFINEVFSENCDNNEKNIQEFIELL